MRKLKLTKSKGSWSPRQLVQHALKGLSQSQLEAGPCQRELGRRLCGFSLAVLLEQQAEWTLCGRTRSASHREVLASSPAGLSAAWGLGKPCPSL